MNIRASQCKGRRRSSQQWGSSLLKLKPLEVLKPPKPFETGVPASETRRPQGLFKTMLQDDPHLILEDLQSNPSSHPPQIESLLNELQARTRSPEDLLPEERNLLDYAAAVALTRGPKRNAPRQTPQPARGASPDVQPIPKSPYGEDGLPAYWWLK